MTRPKLFAMILFGILAFLFGVIFTNGPIITFGALMTGSIVAGLTGAFMFFAETPRHAFARGFLGLGSVFIIVPIAALVGLAEQVAEGARPALETGIATAEHDDATFTMTEIILPPLFAPAGLVFGVTVGVLMVLIGGLTHRKPRA